MSRRHSALPLSLLVVVLLTSACATSVAKKTPTATLPPTATPVLTPPPLSIKPAHPVVWTAHQLPPGLTLTAHNWYSPALTPADGATAYLCNYVDGRAQIWATHDRAAHWTVAGSVAGEADNCDVLADQLDTRRAIVLLFKSKPSATCCGAGSYIYYRTADSGATWTPIDIPADNTPLINEVATEGGVTYALAATLSHSSCSDCYESLSVSRDGMLTWTRIDASVFLKSGYGAERSISRFWLGSTGELLAEVIHNAGPTTFELWRSGDQGAHWTQIDMGRSGTVDTIVVGDDQGQRFWRACAAYQTLGDYTHPPVQQISCTIDGGKTWLDTGGENSYHSDMFAQASDGALLAVTPNPYHGERATKLLRIAPGQSAWESLGALSPAGGGVRASGFDPTVLWSVMRPADYGQPLTTVYTATYP